MTRILSPKGNTILNLDLIVSIRKVSDRTIQFYSATTDRRSDNLLLIESWEFENEEDRDGWFVRHTIERS